MVDCVQAMNIAEAGRAIHSCDGCGKCDVPIRLPSLSSISMQNVLVAARQCIVAMDTIPKGLMVDDGSAKVRCDGTPIFSLVTFGDQSDEDERWDEEYQPLTSAKAMAFFAWLLLSRWQQSMLFTYRKDMDVSVFVEEDLKMIENIAKQGDQDKMRRAILGLRITRLGNINAKTRF